jgi:hypothetical protein
MGLLLVRLLVFAIYILRIEYKAAVLTMRLNVFLPGNISKKTRPEMSELKSNLVYRPSQ